MCASDHLDGDVPPFFPPTMKNVKNRNILQLYKLKQKHNIDHSQQRSESNKKQSLDWLAFSTVWLQWLLAKLPDVKTHPMARKFLSSNLLNHLISASLMSIVFFVVSSKMLSEPVQENKRFWSLVYVATLAMHFGAQIWMTVVSGLVLYFSLPRHTFGNVQEHLFPAFYTHSSTMSFFLIISFVKIQNEINVFSKVFVQILCLVLVFSIELFIRLYVARNVVLLKHTKTKMEAAAGYGQEIGKHILGELANCPHYMKLLRRFRKLHSYTAVGTLVSVMCSVYHLNYLSERLCL